MLLQQNIAHFGQADDTLFANPEFQRAFGYMGTTDIVEKLIWGKYINPSMSTLTEGARHLLQKLGNKENLPKNR
jgi:hypothetical protein